jgi:hypothetical protein
MKDQEGKDVSGKLGAPCRVCGNRAAEKELPGPHDSSLWVCEVCNDLALKIRGFYQKGGSPFELRKAIKKAFPEVG